MYDRSEKDRPVESGRGSFLALAAACGLGVAQPLYDLLGSNPTLLVAHQATWVDALLFALLVSVALPLVLWIPVAALGRVHSSAGKYLAGSLVGLALALLPLQASRQWPEGATGRLVLLGLLGLALGVVYLRWGLFRRLLVWLAAAALIFPILFLLRPEIASLGRHAEGDGPVARLEIERPTPVVIVVLDELPISSLLTREGAIYAERFPNFARLQRGAHWFSNATTVAHNTGHAVPAILTGRYPHGRPTGPDRESYPENLFSLLAGSFNLNVFEIVSNICADSCDDPMTVRTHRERWGPALADVSAVFAALVMAEAGPAVDAAWSGFWGRAAPSAGDEATDHWEWRDPPPQYEAFERRLAAFPRNTLHFAHLMLPHRPWQFFADGKAYIRDGDQPHGLLKRRHWVGTEWEVLQAQQRHLLQLQYTDTLIGRLLDTLERLGKYDETLLIVTSDHGASFKRGGLRRGLTRANLLELAHVPLLVKLPGQTTAATDDRNVQTIDIVPTIAEVLGFEVPWTVDGVSLLSDAPRPDEKNIYRTKGKRVGDPWTFAASRTAETMDVVEAIEARYPESDLFAVAPDATSRALLGAPVAPRLGPAATARAVVSRLDDYDSVYREDWWVPSHVIGSLVLDQPTRSRPRLAIALNGMVRAVTEAYARRQATTLGFTAMIDPKYFVPGDRHELELFLIESEGGESLLRPIPVSAKE